jgi:thioredoxin 1
VRGDGTIVVNPLDRHLRNGVGSPQGRHRNGAVTEEKMKMEVKQIRSAEGFERAIQGGVTLMDFNAPWCAPCRSQEPILETLAQNFEGKALVASMNVDENREVAARLGIMSIPTLVIFKDNKEIQRFVGLQPEAALSEALNQLVK